MSYRTLPFIHKPMSRLVTLLIMFLSTLHFCSCPAMAQTAVADTCAVEHKSLKDSICITPRRKGFFKRVGHGLYEFVKEFSRIDTAFIEPQHYNFTVMLQNTNTYEVYRLSTERGNSVRLAPKPSVKLGPYFGWRWVFLGYTFDLNHLNVSKTKTEFDLSLYSSQIGIDLFYRKTGNDYRIKSIKLDDDTDTSPMHNVSYDGLNASIKGFNLYYIFNHRRFSYPAAFSQSTMQKRSCGSALLGIGYTQHSLKVDMEKLNDLIHKHLGADVSPIPVGSELGNGKVRYTDVSVSGGYAYNFAFAPCWLFASSLSLALAYKQTNGESAKSDYLFKDFDIHNFNIDGVGRFGLVWNNNRWYAGASTILHSYNYSKKRFSTNNVFGNLNIYVGFNFCKR